MVCWVRDDSLLLVFVVLIAVLLKSSCDTTPADTAAKKDCNREKEVQKLYSSFAPSFIVVVNTCILVLLSSIRWTEILIICLDVIGICAWRDRGSCWRRCRSTQIGDSGHSTRCSRHGHCVASSGTWCSRRTIRRIKCVCSCTWSGSFRWRSRRAGGGWRRRVLGWRGRHPCTRDCLWIWNRICLTLAIFHTKDITAQPSFLSTRLVFSSFLWEYLRGVHSLGASILGQEERHTQEA